MTVGLAASVATSSASAAPAPASSASWGPCPAIHGASADTVCTVVRVPRDYARPSAGSISVTVSKLPAGDQANKRGVLIGNPGGPGGDGIPMFTQAKLPTELRAQWDLIAVQPRGLIGANPVACAPVSPSSPATVFAGGAVARSACDARTPGGTENITTENTARDIDSAREQLGLGPRVNLLGISYGTTLMSTYATLFPQHTDRLILDSAVNPTIVWNTLLTAQTAPYRARTQAMFAWIAGNDATYHLGRTPLAVYREWSRKVAAEAGVPPSLGPPPAQVGDTPPAMRTAFDAFLRGSGTAAARAYFDNLVASLATGKSQNASNLLTLTRVAAPSRDDWPRLAQRIILAPRPARQLPSNQAERQVNSSSMQLLLLCNENAVTARPQVAPASLLDSFVIGDPYTGASYLFESGLACSGAAPVARPVRISNRGLAVTPLQLQSIGDPQTPYPGGLIHRDRMRSHLITVGGGDHVQFGRGNPVVDAAIVEYLRTGSTSVTRAPEAPLTTPLLPPR
ncbi:transporter [Williamsia sp. Leaf354]|nr:transporter [Williamsia sp. Leaf354]